MEPDVHTMTLDEYLDYERNKDRELWDELRERISKPLEEPDYLKEYVNSTYDYTRWDEPVSLWKKNSFTGFQEETLEDKFGRIFDEFYGDYYEVGHAYLMSQEMRKTQEDYNREFDELFADLIPTKPTMEDYNREFDELLGDLFEVSPNGELVAARDSSTRRSQDEAEFNRIFEGLVDPNTEIRRVHHQYLYEDDADLAPSTGPGMSATLYTVDTTQDELLNIDSDIFTYETETCIRERESNYLLQIDPDLFTGNGYYHNTYVDEEADMPKANNVIWEEENLWYNRWHWCDPIFLKYSPSPWPSCVPFKECDGGGTTAENHPWRSIYNDQDRTLFPTGITSWDIWMRITTGCVTREKILNRIHETKEPPDNPHATEEDEYKRSRVREVLLRCLQMMNATGDFTIDSDEYQELKNLAYSHNAEGFVDDQIEVDKQDACFLLGIDYKAPPPIRIERYDITRYYICEDEKYIWVQTPKRIDLQRTSENIARVRAEVMDANNEGGHVFHDPH